MTYRPDLIRAARAARELEGTDLFAATRGLVRPADPETSLAAAVATLPHVGPGVRLVLQTLHQYGPLTDHDLASHTGRQLNSIGKRRLDAVTAGWVEPAWQDGAPLTRPSPTGCRARVWTLTPAGITQTEQEARDG